MMGESLFSRLRAFVPASDSRVTTCAAWQMLMRFRELLMTRENAADEQWALWIELINRGLRGTGVFGDGFCREPEYGTTLAFGVERESHVNTRRSILRNDRPREPRPEEERRMVLFPPNAPYFLPGIVIDETAPFPSIANRDAIVQWVESWLDFITVVESSRPLGAISGLGDSQAQPAPDRVDSAGDKGNAKPSTLLPEAMAPIQREPTEDAFLSEADVANVGGVKQDTLRKHLPEWRRRHHNNDWLKVANPRPRDPKFQYRWGSIKPLVESIRRPANVPAKKIKPPKP